MKEQAINAALACDGYVEVQSAPYTYDNGAEAEGEDPVRVPLLWTFNPQKRRIARNDGSDGRIFHLCYESVKAIDSMNGARRDQPLRKLGMGYLQRPSLALSWHGTDAYTVHHQYNIGA